MTSLDRINGYVFALMDRKGTKKVRDYLQKSGMLHARSGSLTEDKYELRDGSVVIIKGVFRKNLFVPQSLDETTINALFAEAGVK